MGRPKGINKIFVGMRLDEDVVVWLREKRYFSRYVNKILHREKKREDNKKEVI